MNITVREVKNDSDEIIEVKDFLYGQIMEVYGIGPTPKFHYDIEGIREYYILPSNNAIFVAYDGDKIVATAAIRAYDKDYEFFRGIYPKENTASIWRLMVDENYRRHGLARKLIGKIESFSKLEGYSKIYLHTHRYLDAALPFWKSLGYKIVLEEDDYDETTHMEKCLS
jgi:GNAT superfamily N-acetyltransferase